MIHDYSSKFADQYSLTLFLLHKIEDKYGSIANCPDDDPTFVKLQQVNKYVMRSVDDEKQDKIISLAKQGYPAIYIFYVTHIRTKAIKNILTRRGIRPKQSFKYLLKTSNGIVCFTNSLSHYVKTVFHYRPRYNYEIVDFLKRKGYRIIQDGKFYWPNIKVGDYFLLTYMKAPKKKTDDNSYVYRPVTVDVE